MYQFLLSWVLASFNEILDPLIKLVGWLIVALFDVAIDLIDMVPIQGGEFKGVCDGLENFLQIFLSLLISGYW